MMITENENGTFSYEGTLVEVTKYIAEALNVT